MSKVRTLIVGIGSPHGDDQAGWLIAERLKAVLARADGTVRTATSPIELLDWLDGLDRLMVCDACRGLGRVGEVRRWNWPARELASASWSGTHDLSLAAVLQLASRLGRLPKSVLIWSIEGRVGTALARVSPKVAAALPRMTEEIVTEATRGTTTQDEQCTNSRS